MTGRAAPSIAEAEAALALDRNRAPADAVIGWTKIFLGRADETEHYIAQAPRLSPRDHTAFLWCNVAGTAKLCLGRDDEAVGWLRREIESNRTYATADCFLAAALAQLGRVAEAAARWRMAVRSDLHRPPLARIRVRRQTGLAWPTSRAWWMGCARRVAEE